VGLRSRALAPAATALVVSVVAAAGLYELVAPAAATSLWYVSRGPKLQLHVAAGCPKSVRGYQDVVNTFPGPPLVPAGPTSGLICRYRPSVLPQGASRLARQTGLGTAQARRLATAVRKLDLATPSGAASCPADFGSVALIGFAYPARPDVALWYQASGCQSIDNGRLGASETGNPSFYAGFLGVVNSLSPPVAGAGLSQGPGSLLEARTTSSGSNLTARCSCPAPSASSSRRVAAAAPSSYLGWRTDVRGGDSIDAQATSS
jgi:hypothetical protein